MAGLLVLAAVGLVTLGVVTYTEQRSFLYDRADQQAQDAEPVVSQQLDQSYRSATGFPPDDDDRYPGPQRHGPPHNNPAGYAVGQHVDANGNFVGSPAVLSIGSPRHAEVPEEPGREPLHHRGLGGLGTQVPRHRVPEPWPARHHARRDPAEGR